MPAPETKRGRGRFSHQTATASVLIPIGVLGTQAVASIIAPAVRQLYLARTLITAAITIIIHLTGRAGIVLTHMGLAAEGRFVLHLMRH